MNVLAALRLVMRILLQKGAINLSLSKFSDLQQEIEKTKRWVFTAPYGLEVDEKNQVIPRKKSDDEYVKIKEILDLFTKK